MKNRPKMPLEISYLSPFSSNLLKEKTGDNNPVDSYVFVHLM